MFPGAYSLAATTNTFPAVACSSVSGKNPKLPNRKPPKSSKPTVFEIERAIGAGVFRDRDTSEPLEKNSFYDNIFSNTIGSTEGSTEKQLRETGEWLSQKTERASRSSETVRSILGVVFIWVLPALLVSLAVASGTIKLPFSNPIIEDWIM